MFQVSRFGKVSGVGFRLPWAGKFGKRDGFCGQGIGQGRETYMYRSISSLFQLLVMLCERCTRVFVRFSSAVMDQTKIWTHKLMVSSGLFQKIGNVTDDPKSRLINKINSRLQ